MNYYRINNTIYKEDETGAWFVYDEGSWEEFLYYELPEFEYRDFYKNVKEITEQEAFLEIL